MTRDQNVNHIDPFSITTHQGLAKEILAHGLPKRSPDKEFLKRLARGAGVRDEGRIRLADLLFMVGMEARS